MGGTLDVVFCKLNRNVNTSTLNTHSFAYLHELDKNRLTYMGWEFERNAMGELKYIGYNKSLSRSAASG